MIIRLDADVDADVTAIGGKAVGLLRLIRSGLPVPDAWCVPAEVSQQTEARAHCVTESLAQWWKDVAAQRPGSLWAVRSSAVAEDLDDASFAGVYQTVLGVDTLPALRDALQVCWDSVDQTRAHAYRTGQARRPDLGIAVVIQQMLTPRAAGVLLTANPLRPFADEIVIDASWGLGEAVVSGRTDPDHIRLDRTTGRVLDHRIGNKNIEIVWAAGILERPVDEARQAEPCLNATELQQLWQLATAVGEQIGPRRDLEWALADGTMYLLQDRAITTLPSENPTDIWSRRFGDEYLAECSLPLPGELMVPWIVEAAFQEMAALQGRSALAAAQPVRLHKGYAYFSATYYVESLRMLPRSMRANPAGEWFPAIVDRWAHTPPWNPLLLAGFALSPFRDRRRSGLKRNLVALEKHCTLVEQQVMPLLTQDYARLTTADWLRQFDGVEQVGREHFRVIRWGMTAYNPFLHAGLAKLLQAWCDDRDGTVYQDLISGLDGTKTAQLNTEIASLAGHFTRDTVLCDAVAAGVSYESARELTASASVWDHYDEFVRRHGHRSASRDIAKPRWHEQPHIILELIRAQLRAGGSAASGSPASTAQLRRTQAERTMARSAGTGLRGRIHRQILRRLTATVQDYTRYRENQRYYLDYIITHARSLVLEQGRRLTAAGLLGERDDVFLLTKAEFLAAVRGTQSEPDLAEVLRHRRRAYAGYQSSSAPLFLFDDVEVEQDSEEPEDTADLPPGTLRGVGISRGCAQGPVRVVASLEDLGSVRAGDILVAPNIDPGWTSVFPLLAGLVIETGGMLAHGAILAREYGIPAVSGLSGATARLMGQTTVEVDGKAGLVRSLD